MRLAKNTLRINLTIADHQGSVLDSVAKDRGLSSRSAAVRYIIHDWLKLQAERAEGVMIRDQEWDQDHRLCRQSARKSMETARRSAG